EMLRRQYNSARGFEAKTRLDAMIKLAAAQVPIADNGRDWDRKTGIVGCPNGVIDLRTGKLRDGRRDDRITMQLGVEYDPSAKCPRFDGFVLEVFDNDA